MEYVTAKEVADATRPVQNLCEKGKIYRVIRLGKVWAISKSAEKPADS